LTLEPIPESILSIVKDPSTESSFAGIGEVARLTGVSVDTLRHYESKGLLRPVRARNGYRKYPESAIARVRLIRSALAIGFGLDDLSRLLKVRDAGGRPCADVRDMAATKLAELQSLISDLSATRDVLITLLEDWDQRLHNDPTRPVHLLETLSLATQGKTAANGDHLNRNLKSKSRKRMSQS